MYLWLLGTHVGCVTRVSIVICTKYASLVRRSQVQSRYDGWLEGKLGENIVPAVSLIIVGWCIPQGSRMFGFGGIPRAEDISNKNEK